MEEIIYNYTLTKEIYRDGIMLTGGMGVSKTKKILFTLLAVVALANEIYAFVKTGKVTSYVLLFAIIALLVTTWVGPIIEKNKLFKNFSEKEMQISVTKEVITVNGGEKVITAKDYRGFDDRDNYFIIYFNNGFLLLPKNATNGFGVESTKEILNTFHATAVNAVEETDTLNNEEKEEN